MEEYDFYKEKNRARILIVDDEEDTRDIFTRQLEDEYEIDTAHSAALALEKIRNEKYQIVMTDLVMPGEDGISLLKKIKKERPHISVIMISGKASIEKAVEAMKLGAEEFIEKPVEDLDLLKLVIRRILKVSWQNEEILRLRHILSTGFDRTNIVGNSFAIQKILNKVRKIAPLDTTVLISGETGVGKELFAELIYQNSKRKEGKFVAVNCGGLPESLLESMLFGHKKGSFTSAIRDKIGYFQEADGGTLFLDEITETTPGFQIKLLRALEKGVIRQVGGDRDIDVDVRVIAASNRDIETEIKKGTFREDLYYRLNVINIPIPPLRERVEDIKILAKTFVKEFSEKHDKQSLEISPQVMNMLAAQPWKGNVRELKNAMEHAVALSSHSQIVLEDLPGNVYKNMKQSDGYTPYDNLPFSKAKEAFEKNYVERLLKACKGDVTKAATISEIKRQNLYEKFKKYGIDVKKFRE